MKNSVSVPDITITREQASGWTSAYCTSGLLGVDFSPEVCREAVSEEEDKPETVDSCVYMHLRHKLNFGVIPQAAVHLSFATPPPPRFRKLALVRGLLTKQFPQPKTLYP